MLICLCCENSCIEHFRVLFGLCCFTLVNETHCDVMCGVLGSQQWFVVKNLNAESSVYFVKLRAVNGRGAGAASATIEISTVVVNGRLCCC